MSYSNVLDEISKMYKPGCVAYYEKRTPDEWQQTLDDLEKNHPNDPDFEEACAKAIARFRILTQRFIEDSKPAKTVSIADAFTLAENFPSRQSTTEKVCYVCQTKQGLQIETYGKNLTEVRLVCKTHKANLDHKKKRQ